MPIFKVSNPYEFNQDATKIWSQWVTLSAARTKCFVIRSCINNDPTALGKVIEMSAFLPRGDLGHTTIEAKVTYNGHVARHVFRDGHETAYLFKGKDIHFESSKPAHFRLTFRHLDDYD